MSPCCTLLNNLQTKLGEVSEKKGEPDLTSGSEQMKSTESFEIVTEEATTH